MEEEDGSDGPADEHSDSDAGYEPSTETKVNPIILDGPRFGQLYSLFTALLKIADRVDIEKSTN